MKFISTNQKSPEVLFLEAMRNGLAPDGGLYMPAEVPELPQAFWRTLNGFDFSEIAFQMAKPYLKDELSDSELRRVISEAFQFPLSVNALQDDIHILELFHGPTLAFKDFGARFMARLFSKKAQKEQQEVTILVATSGDTGSAVAQGFYKVPGVIVCLLYPKGKVSPLQEKQMTTLGENIIAVEVDGVFDDCQRLVKSAFLDEELNKKMQLSSANSINIARLLPQSFYYAYAVSVLIKDGYNTPVFSVPSGNFGNLTGGLLAMKMGLPVKQFIAATNVNDVVPEYLSGADFTPRSSKQTISNAMDVGDPSNFARIRHLFNQSDADIRKTITGLSYTDSETLETIKRVNDEQDYLMCPHTAIGYRAALDFKKRKNIDTPVIVLATAHPVKFRDVIEPEINQEIDVPARLRIWLQKEKKSTAIGSDFDGFKEFLMKNQSND